MLGSEKFISWTKDRFFKKKIDKEVPVNINPRTIDISPI
ncbi:hypothetical protein D1BOALGB6SA_8277 [Olavius sp. associated proteobacterium Delta 1]|nr:hypothetical protein D1BOALGB6SA_8277 [Olavius sp. associated proteobacterium Delta 1]